MTTLFSPPSLLPPFSKSSISNLLCWAFWVCFLLRPFGLGMTLLAYEVRNARSQLPFPTLTSPTPHLTSCVFCLSFCVVSTICFDSLVDFVTHCAAYTLLPSADPTPSCVRFVTAALGPDRGVSQLLSSSQLCMSKSCAFEPKQAVIWCKSSLFEKTTFEDEADLICE